MKNLKKVIAVLLALTLSVSLAACGQKQTGKQEPAQKQETAPKTEEKAPANETKAEPVKIVYARGMDATKANINIIEAFNKKYEGKIKVEFVEMPSDTGKQHDQYVTSFSAGGTEYDVFDVDVIWPAEFAQAGYSLPLDKLIEKDGINMDDYMKGQVAAGTFKGKLWAFPKFIDAGLLFYRKDIVDKAPATWEELIAAAKANKGKNGTKFGYLMQAKQYEGLVCNAVEFISAYGGSVVDGDGNIIINSPQTIKGLKVMKEIVNSDFVPNNITTFAEPESHTAFIEGQSVFIRNWPYQWALGNDEKQSKIVGKLAMAPLPKGDARAAATLGGWMTMINKNTKHPEAAWEFVKFMCGPEGQKISAIDGGLSPTYLPLYKDADVIAKNPHMGDPGFVEGLKAAVPRPVSPIYPKLSEIMQIEISKALAGQQSVEDAVKKMDEQMKAAVAAAK
ncbi:MAG: trehalose/maltose transport system substrate-binding protein [Petroclostridium sp.]|jgi:multiple sugar transport system substrate-binding protein|uniref:ABC transporter substrate-binding protein n=1 Tax=Petroclostridium xylanilyticum TaxID=1792311 RepID=UPI000B992489|nr:ABC transporter substrate-binding protein [Petroclostridium xylanilyticum]MBZ4646857.1 extracellular solute-binding protein family 1 [Clostridia bacterium]MDK2810514.1 trehalose/maltose transport system substrate-binding protein [Petroclostridium sp.]